jgi:ferritin-like metal-binding protein YciE
MKVKTLNDLFVHELKDLYSAEKQLTKALPQMAKAATNLQLKQAIENHLAETEE